MTEKEAIKLLQENMSEIYFVGEHYDAMKMAISALKEIQQYRAMEQVGQLKEYEAIGTVKECREAREKQKAEKVVVVADSMVGRDDDGEPVWEAAYKCPECECYVEEEYAYCPFCGQQLDWSEDEVPDSR